jgi:hypothetical protein
MYYFSPQKQVSFFTIIFATISIAERILLHEVTALSGIHGEVFFFLQIVHIRRVGSPYLRALNNKFEGDYEE